jgi:hypothetical protein
MKSPLARFISLAPSPQGILVTLRLGPNITKAQINEWMGEEDALVGLVHPPAEVQLSNKPPAKKGGEKCKWLGARCKEKAFQEFCMHMGWIAYLDSNKEMAETNTSKAVRGVCGVKSRAEIDSNPEASNSFIKLIQHPYAAYMKEKGK